MPRSIDDLMNDVATDEPIKGITLNDLEVLRNSGLHTVESIIYARRKHLLDSTGFTESKYNIIYNQAIKLCSSMVGFKSAQTVYRDRELSVLKISTGSEQLDFILDGGIELGSITEVYGRSGCGKTQLCHTIAVTCQLSVLRGGCGRRCIYIDTENTFRPKKIKDIATRFNLDYKECLENILVATCHNSDHQEILIREASRLIVKDQFSLIIVDSISHTLRNEFLGLGELANRQQLFGKQLRLLKDLAGINNCACLITNQIVDDVSSNGPSTSTINYSPVGGHMIAHASTTRLLFERRHRPASSSVCISAHATTRLCKIIKSPYLPEGKSYFSITSSGIQDLFDPSIARMQPFVAAKLDERHEEGKQKSINDNKSENDGSSYMSEKNYEYSSQNDSSISEELNTGKPIKEDDGESDEVSFTQLMAQPRPNEGTNKRLRLVLDHATQDIDIDENNNEQDDNRSEIEIIQSNDLRS